jgi:hypothetical protein
MGHFTPVLGAMELTAELGYTINPNDLNTIEPLAKLATNYIIIGINSTTRARLHAFFDCTG